MNRQVPRRVQQRVRGSINARAVLGLLEQERKTGYGRRPPGLERAEDGPTTAPDGPTTLLPSPAVLVDPE